MLVTAAQPSAPRALAQPAAPQTSEEPTLGQKVSLEIQDTLSSAFQTYQAMPRFLYPSVFGTAAEKELIFNTLDMLPISDVVNAPTIAMKDTLGSANLLGVTRPAIGSIAINRTGWGMGNPANVAETLVHEVGHTVDYPGRIVQVLTGGNSSSAPFGEGPYVSDYASTMHQEDFAETYAAYHLDPEGLKRVNPAKYEAMQQLEQPNFMEAFLDQPAFRETGRFVGDALSFTPWLRWGLEFAGQVGSFSLAVEGIGDLFGEHRLRGAVTTAAAAGLIFAFKHPLAGPAAMGLLGARRGYDMAAEKQAGATSTALAMTGAGAGGLVGGVAGPLGLTMAGHAAAGPIGGAVGLAVGAILGHKVGSTLGGKAGLWVGEQIASALKEEQPPAQAPAAMPQPLAA